jgi:hypothetical protein
MSVDVPYRWWNRHARRFGHPGLWKWSGREFVCWECYGNDGGIRKTLPSGDSYHVNVTRGWGRLLSLILSYESETGYEAGKNVKHRIDWLRQSRRMHYKIVRYLQDEFRLRVVWEKHEAARRTASKLRGLRKCQKLMGKARAALIRNDREALQSLSAAFKQLTSSRGS